MEHARDKYGAAETARRLATLVRRARWVAAVVGTPCGFWGCIGCLGFGLLLIIILTVFHALGFLR